MKYNLKHKRKNLWKIQTTIIVTVFILSIFNSYSSDAQSKNGTSFDPIFEVANHTKLLLDTNIIFSDGFETFDAVNFSFPRTGIHPDELGVIVNDNDPLSIAIATEYINRRNIPVANVIHVSMAVTPQINRTDFQSVYDIVNNGLPSTVQATVLTWTSPQRVDCMSITSAFAFGFDEKWCNTSGQVCGSTNNNPLFFNDTTLPFNDIGVRPSMMLAATSLIDAIDLIERGIAADGTLPNGDGYLLRTTDTARSVRWPNFAVMPNRWASTINFNYIDNSDGSGSNVISNTNDILFYFTGLSSVPSIGSNNYLPGAIADHLTSFGGRIPSGQMSAIKWLEAGVTGSFGTVLEPCNFTQKFPNVQILTDSYFRGATLLESYWKSVAWPGEGLFIGEPLARPFESQLIQIQVNDIVIETNAILPGDTGWVIEESMSEAGPWSIVQLVNTPTIRSRTTITIPRPRLPFLRLIQQ